MFLLPKPKKCDIKNGFLKSKFVKINNFCSDERVEKALKFFDIGEDVVLTVKSNTSNSEGYYISIIEDKIEIEGDSPAGTFYAIQTLKQIFRNDIVPCLEIHDKPDMKYRGFYHDVTRGKVPTVEKLKKLIDKMAYYKMNSLQLYVEHTFPFKELGNEIYKTGYLSADELKELDEYCYDNFIEFIPSIATFGHLYELLEQDKYKMLQCIENDTEDRIFWTNRMLHHTIDPTNAESFKLVKSLIDQYMPIFRSNIFNICCDETFDLKNGKHKDEDTGSLYVGFVKKIIEYLQTKGKTVMMWGDILLQYPHTISELPNDIIFLNWNYSAEPQESQFKVLAEMGCKQVMCPGTSSWSRLVEGVDTESKNIIKLSDYGYKFDAIGVLNTNWGDYGNPCSLKLSMYGLILGASKSWNKDTICNEKFNGSINTLEYKNEAAVKYLSMIDEAHKNIVWNRMAYIYSNLNHEDKFEVEYPTREEILHSVSLCKSVIEELVNQRWEIDEYRVEIMLAAEGIMVMAELFAKFAMYNLKRQSDTFHWLREYRNSWCASNKESELAEIEKMFVFLEEYKCE